jgi:hypothetical protein
MDRSLLDSEYMCKDTADAFDVFYNLKRTIKNYNGNYIVLWHNNSLLAHKELLLYETLISSYGDK